MSKEKFDKGRRELLVQGSEEMKNPDNCITFKELEYKINIGKK
jgi:hypothetical protein